MSLLISPKEAIGDVSIFFNAAFFKNPNLTQNELNLLNVLESNFLSQ